MYVHTYRQFFFTLGSCWWRSTRDACRSKIHAASVESMLAPFIDCRRWIQSGNLANFDLESSQLAACRMIARRGFKVGIIQTLFWRADNSPRVESKMTFHACRLLCRLRIAKYHIMIFDEYHTHKTISQKQSLLDCLKHHNQQP